MSIEVDTEYTSFAGCDMMRSIPMDIDDRLLDRIADAVAEKVIQKLMENDLA